VNKEWFSHLLHKTVNQYNKFNHSHLNNLKPHTNMPLQKNTLT